MRGLGMLFMNIPEKYQCDIHFFDCTFWLQLIVSVITAYVKNLLYKRPLK